MGTVDPRTSMIINIITAVLGVVAGSAAYFTQIFGQQTAQTIVMTAGFAVAIVTAINGGLHAISSTEPSPGAK